jgi:hypothetical protein
MSEIIVERTTERKISKPAPYTDEMLGMIERFRGLSKEEMIAKINSANCGPSWTPYQKRVAKAAMLLHLKGLAPAPAPKKTEITELDDDIDMAIQRSKPRSAIELELEAELRKEKAKPKVEEIVVPESIPEIPAEKPEIEEKEEELPIAPAKELKIAKVEKVDGRRKGKSLRDLIPEDKKK